MADGCLATLPVHLASPNSSNHLFPHSSTPIRLLHLSYPSSPLLSPHFFLYTAKEKIPSLLPLVARTSGWVGEGSIGSPDRKEIAEGAVFPDSESRLDEGFGGGGGGESYPPLMDEAKLFVGNLPYDIDSEKLAGLFQNAGVVEVAEVIYKRESGESRGFGFVTMSTVEEAEQAVELYHRYDWNGRFLAVNKAAPRGSRPESPGIVESSFRIYVGNLPWQVDDAGLEQIFSEHGEVLNTRVVYDRETGRSRGFGFVTMASKHELDDAIAALDGQSLDGRAIRVDVAGERPTRRSSF